ncbi:MAG TPA: hypothetical protein VD969_19465 [Symbiobacteriaceae bacterium]|nr:hypothetical protein [Symbiobacteriaceae bacterium]
MDWKKKTVCGIMVLLVALLPASALAHHNSCYYDPDTMIGIGCSTVDYEMISLKNQMTVAALLEDTATFWDLAGQAADLEARYGGVRLVAPGQAGPALHIRAWVPLSHYQVLDSTHVGDNVRYATVRGARGRPELIFWDRLGRPMKVSGYMHTSQLQWLFNTTVSWSVGFVLGGGTLTAGATSVATAGSVVIPKSLAAFGDGLVSLGTAVAFDIPDAGDANILVDVLGNPDSNGDRRVYRNLVVVKEDGSILLKTMDNGTYWQDLGIVSYDADGQPVW